MAKKIIKEEIKVEKRSVEDISQAALRSIEGICVENSVLQNTTLTAAANTLLWVLGKQPYMPNPPWIFETEIENVKAAMKKILNTGNGNG